MAIAILADIQSESWACTEMQQLLPEELHLANGRSGRMPLRGGSLENARCTPHLTAIAAALATLASAMPATVITAASVHQ